MTNVENFQNELEQLFEQVSQRKERLLQLSDRRQELDQASERLNHWYEEKRRYLDSDQMIPLKINDIDRSLKKYQVRDLWIHRDERTP